MYSFLTKTGCDELANFLLKECYSKDLDICFDVRVFQKNLFPRKFLLQMIGI